jgi:hypothetical protein
MSLPSELKTDCHSLQHIYGLPLMSRRIEFRYETDIQTVREGAFILLVSGESSGNGGEMRKTIPANFFYFNRMLDNVATILYHVATM